MNSQLMKANVEMNAIIIIMTCSYHIWCTSQFCALCTITDSQIRSYIQYLIPSDNNKCSQLTIICWQIKSLRQALIRLINDSVISYFIGQPCSVRATQFSSSITQIEDNIIIMVTVTTVTLSGRCSAEDVLADSMEAIAAFWNTSFAMLSLSPFARAATASCDFVSADKFSITWWYCKTKLLTPAIKQLW